MRYSNNMMIKPKVEYHKALVFTILCAGISSIIFQTSSSGRIKGDTSNFTASEIISISNAARQEQGISPLKPQPQLMEAAAAKAKAMIAANSWSHNTPTQTPWQFIDTTGYIYIIAGENLAKDFENAQDVVAAWLNSPSHRENLLNPEYSDTGVAVIEGSFQQKTNSTLVVQYLAKAVATPSAINTQPYSQPDMLEKSTPSPFIYMGIGFVLAGIFFFFLFVSTKNLKKKTSSRYIPKSNHLRR